MATLLDFFWNEYHREYQLADTSSETYRSALSMFETWYEDTHGAVIQWRNISHETINDWLIAIAPGRSSWTVKSRKLSLLAILNTARRRGLCAFDRERVRRIRTEGTVKDFWRCEEVKQLVDATGQLRGRFRKTQIRKDYYAHAYILVVWDTALRRGDMAVLNAAAIDSNLEFSHPRQKTGVTDICRINAETYRWIQLTFDQHNSNRRLLFPPWQAGKDPLRAVSDLFNQTMMMAGLRASDSCLKKLVRSSIMEADRLAPGTGWLQGHHTTPNTTMQAYANRQAANLNRPKNSAIS